MNGAYLLALIMLTILGLSAGIGEVTDAARARRRRPR